MFSNLLRKGKKIIPYSLTLTLLFSACKKEKEVEPTTQTPAKPTTPPANDNKDECLTASALNNGEVIPGQYIVKYAETGEKLGTRAFHKVLRSNRIDPEKILRTFDGHLKGVAIKLESSEVENLKKDPNIELIEQDKIVSISDCPARVEYQAPGWGAKRVGHAEGSGKYVWVIDTGVDLSHPDLVVDAYKSKSFISGTTVNDDHGHGTHVAGIIAAKDNGFGTVGVASGATVIALKSMDAQGKGSISNIIAAVQYIEQYGKTGDVINMSLGGGYSPSLDKEVLNAANKGFVFSIAAGNSGIKTDSSSPAKVNHPNIYTVSAMDSTDTFASFSNYGKSVDYCAPGVKIVSTYKNGGYATISGTSMAAPHMAGILLMRGKNFKKDGFVKNDPDGSADPIPHL